MVGRISGGKVRAKARSKSARAGIVFPVGRVRRKLKGELPKFRFAAGAPVYLAAVAEYLTGKLAGKSRGPSSHSRVKGHGVWFYWLKVVCGKLYVAYFF